MYTGSKDGGFQSFMITILYFNRLPADSEVLHAKKSIYNVNK